MLQMECLKLSIIAFLYGPFQIICNAHLILFLDQEEAIDTVNLSQPFSLASACGTPKYTNYTAGFADCLDYIFYDKSNLTVTEVVPFPSEAEMALHTALPSIVFPSDHIALISTLKWQ